MNFKDKEHLKKKTASGMMILFIRRFIFQIILTLSNVIIARIFFPGTIGTFIIISFIILNIGILTNLGLVHALIQKNSKVNKSELQTIFSVLFLTSLIFILVIYFLAPIFNLFYQGRLNDSDVFWLRIYSLYILIINMSSISQSLLEKKLDYKKLAIGDLVTILISQILIIVFSFVTYGVGSFVLGNILGSFFGMCLYFFFEPWQLGFNFNFRNLKPYLNFGINYQLSTLISAVNASVVPIYIGSILGSEAVAYILLAGGIGQAVTSMTDVIQKLAFTVCARTTNNISLLKSLTERMIKFSCLVSFPFLAIAYVLAPNLITIIYTSKWMPMLTALNISLIAAAFLVVSNLLMQILLALGRAKLIRNISVFWAIMQWILTVVFVKYWNFNGAVLANLFVSMTFFIPLLYLKKEFKFNFLSNVTPYIFYSLIAGSFTFYIVKIFNQVSLSNFVIVSLCGLVFYIALVLIFEKRIILREVREFIKLIIF